MRIFVIVVHWRLSAKMLEFGYQCARIDDAPCARVGRNICSDVYAAFLAQQKVRRPQAKSITLQVFVTQRRKS